MQTESTHSAVGNSPVNLACFEVRGRSYAIDVSHVREIVRVQTITPLPKAPELIEGVIDLRGGVIPIIDLGRALGGEPVDLTLSQARIAVLECDSLVVGLAIEGATDVLSLDPGELEDPPTLATQAGYDTVRAVVRRPNADPVMVLSLDHILESVYRSALPDRGE